jgi:hypothetical protein
MNRVLPRANSGETRRMNISEDCATWPKLGYTLFPFMRAAMSVTSPVTPEWLPRHPRGPDRFPNWKPRLLDLFCCAGGASLGYSRAGLEVVGVDISPQPNYPFGIIQADAMAPDPMLMAAPDAVHKSPPCQSISDLAERNGNADQWPRVIEPVRDMLSRSGLPYIIENVDGAPLLNPAVLCGTMFKGCAFYAIDSLKLISRSACYRMESHPKCHTMDRCGNIRVNA